VADVASKQQTTALFLSTIVTQTRRHTELRKKLKNLMGKLCCAREHSVQLFVRFFTEFNCTVILECMGPLIMYYFIIVIPRMLCWYLHAFVF